MKRLTILLAAFVIHGHALALTIATGSAEGTYFKIAKTSSN